MELLKDLLMVGRMGTIKVVWKVLLSVVMKVACLDYKLVVLMVEMKDKSMDVIVAVLLAEKMAA